MRFRRSDNFGWRRSFGYLKCKPFVRYWFTDHGSLEGVRGLKTNEAYHWKADASLILEM